MSLAAPTLATPVQASSWLGARLAHVVFGLVLVVNLVATSFIAANHLEPFADLATYYQEGQMLAQGQGFTQPVKLNVRSRFTEAPYPIADRLFFPIVVALALKLFGDSLAVANVVAADPEAIAEVVAATFGLRGADYSEAEWDSWRGEDGKWTVALRWRAGRSENSAHWVYHPGAHGGTVTVQDEAAADLVEGLPAKPLRTVRPVTALAQQVVEDSPHRPDELAPQAGAEPVAEPSPGPEPHPGPKQHPEPEPTGRQATKGTRKNHPTVPSWEDVLLGVRKRG